MIVEEVIDDSNTTSGSTTTTTVSLSLSTLVQDIVVSLIEQIQPSDSRNIHPTTHTTVSHGESATTNTTTTNSTTNTTIPDIIPVLLRRLQSLEATSTSESTTTTTTKETTIFRKVVVVLLLQTYPKYISPYNYHPFSVSRPTNVYTLYDQNPPSPPPHVVLYEYEQLISQYVLDDYHHSVVDTTTRGVVDVDHVSTAGPPQGADAPQGPRRGPFVALGAVNAVSVGASCSEPTC